MSNKTLQYHKQFLCFALLALSGMAGCAPTNPGDAVRDKVKQEAESAKRAANNDLDQFGSVKATGSVLRGTDSHGKPLWTLGARDIRVHDESTDSKGIASPRTADLTDARATLYKNGAPESTFKARKIHFVFAADDSASGPYMDLSDGVEMKTVGALVAGKAAQTPVTMTSPTLHVDIKPRRMHTESGVVMKQNDVVARAPRLAADMLAGNARFDGGVRANDPQSQMTAHAATWDWLAGHLVAEGGVTIVHAGTTLVGDRADAEVNRSSGTLSGHVRANSAQGEGTAAEVRYNWRSGTISSLGGTRLVKNDVTLRADRIDTDDKLNAAVATGGVMMQQQDIVVRAPRVNMMDKMARAVATGGVTVVRGGDTARADAATVWPNEKKAVANGNVTLKHGGMTVRADRADVAHFGDIAHRVVTADGDVRAEAEGGDAEATHVTWEAGKVVGAGGVTLRRGGYTLLGDRLESDEKLQNARLYGQAGDKLPVNGVSAGLLVWTGRPGRQGHLVGSDGVRGRTQTLRLSADNMEANGDASKATFTGHVVMKGEDGSVVRAPKAYYDKAANQVTATGGVEFEDPARGLNQTGKTLKADLRLKQATLTDVAGGGSMKVLNGKKLF